MVLKKGKQNQKIALFTVFTAMVIMAAVFFVPPVLGSADNGEFAAVLAGNGFYKQDRGEKDEYFSYISVKYGVNQYHTEQKAAFSGQTLWLQAAKALHQVFARDKTVFDLRYYTVLLCIYMLCALYLLVEYLAKKLKNCGYVLAIFSVVIFCDAAYLMWLQSLYPEGIFYPALLMVLACVLQLSGKEHRHRILYLLLLGSGLLLVSVSAMPVLWSSVIAGLFLLLFYGWKKKKCIPLLFEPSRHKRYVLLIGGAAAGIFCAGLLFQIQSAGKESDSYHSITRGVMLGAENPVEAADFLGLDSSYSLLDGTSAYEPYPAIDFQHEILERDFYPRVGRGRVLLYYICHPDAFVTTMNLMINQAYTIRPGTGGNYSREAGREPGAVSNFFQLYSRVKETATPRSFGFLLILLVIFWICNRKDWWTCAVISYILAAGLCYMAAVMVSMGTADAARQMFPYNIIYDWFLFLLLARLLDWIFGMGKKKLGGEKQQTG